MMKKLMFIFAALLLIQAGLGQDIDYARNIVQKLASPEFNGRGYVSNGDKMAAEFISEEFSKSGLEPVFGRYYFQKFPVSVNTFPGKAEVKINGKVLEPGKDFLIDAASGPVKGQFRIVTISRNHINSETRVAELIKNAENSFILIDSREKKNEKPDESKKTDEIINFLKFSPEVKIKGFITFTNDKLSWDMSQEQGPRALITVNTDIDPVNIKEIEVSIDARHLAVYETQNVAAMVKGTSGSDSLIVLLAHYDHLGTMGKKTYFPGANDNASGVAMLLNLANYFARNKPEYTTVFVALSAEELGILGAASFTENPPFDLKRIKFLVNFDLAGTGEEGIRVVNGSVYKDKFDMLTRINTEKGLLPKVDIRGAACNSDHCLFYQKGVPCFYIYTQGGIQAYHDIYDRPETLPLTEFADYCKLMIEFLKNI